jgi:cell division protein FtsQ
MRRPAALAARLRPRPAAALRVLPARGRLIAACILVAALVLGALYFFWLRDSSLVRVEQVRVTGVSGDNAHRISKRLRQAAQEMTTLDVDDAALRQAVAAYPEVRGVEAHAEFPNSMRIVVQERTPVGALQAGQRRIAVAADGMLLPEVSTRGLATVHLDAIPDGTRLGDGGALRAVTILAAAPPRLRARIDTLARGKGGLRATLAGGGTLVLGGANDLSAKWEAAVKVLHDPSARGAKYIDVRIPRRPVAGGFPPPADGMGDETTDGTMTADGTTDPTADGTDPSVESTGATTTDGTDPGADGTTDPGADGTTDPSADGTTDSATDPSAAATGDPSTDGTTGP